MYFSQISKILTSADQHSRHTTYFFEKEDSLHLTASSLHYGDRKTQLSILKQMRENASCGIYLLHELPQTSTKIVVLETKLLTGLPKQVEHTADRHHGPPQHTAGESCESSDSQRFIQSVGEQAETDRQTNRWHKQGARPKGSRDIRLSRVSHIAAIASSTPDSAMTRLVITGILPPPIHLENGFEALINVGEESPNVTKHESCQPGANIATNRRSRSSKQRHTAQSTAEPRTLIGGDSIIRNISSRTRMTCCFPQATISNVNKELRNILMKHKTEIELSSMWERMIFGKISQNSLRRISVNSLKHFKDLKFSRS